MSIIFGIRKPMGASVSEQELLHLAHVTDRYAPDGVAVSVAGRVGMGFQPYHTHLRSRLEPGPKYDVQGNLLVVDGRLDNQQDLCQELQLHEVSVPDSEIILAAYLRWGKECFSRFIGDWALALWSTKEQMLYLARDHAGTRTLYFENRNGTLRWSTYLDSFFADSQTIDIDEDYAACYLAAQPVHDLTPYKGIRAVLPAHYVATQDNAISEAPHWQWMSKAKIRYHSEREYDEQFLSLFSQSVERRDGPGAPIVAQLSGGMDSTSIVCMSDRSRRSRNQSADLLDTISFYDDSEPNWNEKPYFSAVEAQRGKKGIHIEMAFMDRTFESHDPSQGLYLLPGADSSALERERRIQAGIGGREYRCILSGIGGDEVLGGVPSPKPELSNYLVAGDFPALFRRTLEWCLTDRSPFFHVLGETANHVFDIYRQPHIESSSIPPWIPPARRKACADIIRRGVTRGKRLGFTPSSVSNGLAWWSIMETLPHTYPGILSRPEYRYPYLDRDLVDYLFSVPREHLLRPGRRRSLMRRALIGIVPDAVLERKRKAFQIRGALSLMQEAQSKIDSLFACAQIVERGFVNPDCIRTTLDAITKGNDPQWLHALMRAIAFELWLKGEPTNRARPR
jgi:asparagine synthase (glutamine-hydrolysing)